MEVPPTPTRVEEEETVDTAVVEVEEETEVVPRAAAEVAAKEAMDSS